MSACADVGRHPLSGSGPIFGEQTLQLRQPLTENLDLTPSACPNPRSIRVIDNYLDAREFPIGGVIVDHLFSEKFLKIAESPQVITATHVTPIRVILKEFQRLENPRSH